MQKRIRRCNRRKPGADPGFPRGGANLRGERENGENETDKAEYVYVDLPLRSTTSNTSAFKFITARNEVAVRLCFYTCL